MHTAGEVPCPDYGGISRFCLPYLSHKREKHDQQGNGCDSQSQHFCHLMFLSAARSQAAHFSECFALEGACPVTSSTSLSVSVPCRSTETEYQGVIKLLSSYFMATWGGDFALVDVRKVSLFKISPDHGCCWSPSYQNPQPEKHIRH